MRGDGDDRMTDEQFKELVVKYERLVYTICYQLTRDHQKSQDLSQETFISVYTNIHRCKESDYKPWIARIATNKAKDYLKSAYYKQLQQSKELSEEVSGDVQDLIGLATGNDETFDIAMTKDMVRNIREKILALKEPYLQVSTMFFIKELSVEEIASLLKRPKKTVHTQLARAKIILQKQIKEDGYGVF